MVDRIRSIKICNFFEKSIAYIKIMITFAIPNQTDDRYENKFPDGKRVYRVYAEGQTHHEH